MSVDDGTPGLVSAYLAQMDNPEILNADPGHLLACTDFNEYPHRHPTRLREVYEDQGSIRKTAAELGSSQKVVSRWLHVYGIRERGIETIAERLEAMEPDDFGRVSE